jgi:predicted nucleotidyltransferase
MSLTSMVIGLEEASVNFVLIGGLAGIVHGSPRMTNDVDVCHDRDPENLERLAKLLAAWNAYPREFPPGLPWEMDVRTLKAATVLTLQTSEGFLDVLAEVAGVGGYAECEAESEWVDFSGHRIRVLGLHALIAAKKAAGRERDLADILTFERILQQRGTMNG